VSSQIIVFAGHRHEAMNWARTYVDHGDLFRASDVLVIPDRHRLMGRRRDTPFVCIGSWRDQPMVVDALQWWLAHTGIGSAAR
jgi:hypothetical protein